MDGNFLPLFNWCWNVRFDSCRLGHKLERKKWGNIVKWKGIWFVDQKSIVSFGFGKMLGLSVGVFGAELFETVLGWNNVAFCPCLTFLNCFLLVIFENNMPVLGCSFFPPFLNLQIKYSWYAGAWFLKDFHYMGYLEVWNM